jgi:hypothetical protein
MKATLCQTFLPGVGNLALAYFLIIIFAIPGLILLRIAGRKISKMYEELRTALPSRLQKIAPPAYSRRSADRVLSMDSHNSDENIPAGYAVNRNTVTAHNPADQTAAGETTQAQ